MGLKIIILAAGSGKRMISEVPKVLHTIGGKPMLEHVVNTAKSLEPTDIIVVYGNGGAQVRQQLSQLDVRWVEQQEQKGTAHAVLQALPFCDAEDRILILYGDVPLISTRLLRQLIQDSPENGLGLVVTELEKPAGFGRIIRNDVGNIVSIVEHRDAKDWQLEINEINTGIITAEAPFLITHLQDITNDNSQQEYYLTDIVAIAVEYGLPIGGIMAHNSREVLGVNDRWQQVEMERYYQYKQAKKLSLTGVHIADYQRLDIRGNCRIGIDTSLDVNVVLEGDVCIGNHCKIGPNVYLKDVQIADHVEILANSVIEGAMIEAQTRVGPFARIRPGTTLKQHSKVGNFVEIKNATLGESSAASHLSYIGDASVGNTVNIGAGVITCNYDGVNKHQTIIGDDVFVGSNTALVAPITLENKVTVGAGSTLTNSVSADRLVVARAHQTEVSDWQRPQKQSVDDKAGVKTECE